MPPRARLGLLLAVVILLADQATKAGMMNLLGTQMGTGIELTPFFNVVVVWNRGMSFGLLHAAVAPWAFVVLALVIAAGLAIWLWRADRLNTALALGLILGGALGNVIDRLRFGAVYDFLDFHLAGWHWPAFNLADSAITVGVILLLLDGLFEPRESPKTSANAR
jgi:signal peptidase II